MTKKSKNTDKENMNPIPWILGMLFVLSLTVIGGWYWNRIGKVERIAYTGLNYLNEQPLRDQLDISTGVHPDSLDMLGIVREIENMPYVKQARINVQPGGTMEVNITERNPIALMINGSRRTYVDAEGIRLPQVNGKTPDVPILYGFKTEPMTDTLQTESFKLTSLFLTELQQRAASNATVSEIVWSDDKGIVILTNESEVKVTIGKSQYGKRLRNWEAFYREVVRNKGISSIESVDLRFEGQIVTREK